MGLIDKELKKVDEQIDTRENYLHDHNIHPENALQYLEDSLTNIKDNRAGNSMLKNKRRGTKGKKGLDVTSCEDSLIANSETNAYSSASHLKSPSRLDTFSVFETSPVLKRVKVSEEEEKHAPGGDSFMLSEFTLPSQCSSQSVRKSCRKRTKSKILREALGEGEESVLPPVKYCKKNKEYRQINKLLELDAKTRKKEEEIQASKS